MSDLIVVAFPGEDTADHGLNNLHALRKEHLIDLEDAAWRMPRSSSATATEKSTSNRPSTSSAWRPPAAGARGRGRGTHALTHR
jgi:uncharacterized membrane protein